MERNVEIVTDSDKKKIVRIHDIRFKGKRSIDWRQVREYLNCWKLLETSVFGKIGIRGISEMLGLDGIDTIHVLNLLFMVKREKLKV